MHITFAKLEQVCAKRWPERTTSAGCVARCVAAEHGRHGQQHMGCWLPEL
jgi:hypothetical protein